jgi:hypothetical protein
MEERLFSRVFPSRVNRRGSALREGGVLHVLRAKAKEGGMVGSKTVFSVTGGRCPGGQRRGRCGDDRHRRHGEQPRHGGDAKVLLCVGKHDRH